MLPYISEVEKYDRKERCLFCGIIFATGYCYKQIVFPKNMGIKYQYDQTCGKIFVCESCHLNEADTNTIHDFMEYHAKIQVGFPEYPPEIEIKKEKNEETGL